MWDTPNKKAKKADNTASDDYKQYEKGTPAHILDNPAYMDEISRFIPKYFGDRSIEEALRNNTQKIDQSEITEEKEREGYYPT